MTGQPPLAEILEFRATFNHAGETTCSDLLHEVERKLMAGQHQKALILLQRVMDLLDHQATLGKMSQDSTREMLPGAPLQLFTLGRFSILLNGKPLEFNARSQEKPIELLKLLISLGGREINKAHVAELMWPDSQGDMANQTLATTLFRLRKLVGKDSILLKSGKLTINPAYCWVDIWQFERCLNQVRATGMQGDMSLFQRAIDLYQGAFLEQEDYGWVIPRRERLRQKLLMSLSEVANTLSQAKRCEEAIVYYQKALEVDDLLEDLYFGLMRCFIRLGRWVEAVSTYRRCRETLQSVLSVEPGDELQALYKELIKQSTTINA